MKKTFFALVATLLFWSNAQAQKYLVLLKDKNGTSFSVNQPDAFLSKRAIERRTRQRIGITPRDLPVSANYVSQIQRTGAKIWYTSRWLNAVLVEANAAQLTAIKALPFYQGLEFGRALAGARVSAERETAHKFGTEAIDYGASQSQIQMLGVEKMHEQGFRGEGMLIGILDSGFQNSDKNPALLPLFNDKRVLSTFDFVKKETSVYEDDSHGNNVFSIMASYREGSLVGPAYRASYVLLRTEDAGSETRLEEANWLIGAEYADSIGVDIINSSLGYNEFDNPAEDYKYADMNGRTALASRAATWAAKTGMVVVVAAGNDGNKPWRFIATPADADSILAIGAVASNRSLAAFSSIGPSADGRIKPDVCAQGVSTVLSNQSGNVVPGNGTSYSSPLVAALVAGFWQAYPQLSAAQVIDCIRKAGHIYTTPNAQFGYGIPTFEKAVAVVQREYILSIAPSESLLESSYVAPNPFSQTPTLRLSPQITGQTVALSLTDLTGRSHWQSSFTALGEPVSLPFSASLPAGLYFLRLNSGKRTEMLKIVKQ
ncbi:MAG: T9SS C-terminal target domain-containing protein [Runella slithyformis]|nr:MAG: T9SS C-terminal target domain-containing protein [Runella slithyformis]